MLVEISKQTISKVLYLNFKKESEMKIEKKYLEIQEKKKNRKKFLVWLSVNFEKGQEHTL